MSNAQRYSNACSRTKPEVRQGTQQTCVNVPVLERDKNNQVVKTGATESRCANGTYTYTVDTTERFGG